jgi:CRP-like cAMP-binding protein
MKTNTSNLKDLAEKAIDDENGREVTVNIGHKKFRPKQEYVMLFPKALNETIERAEEKQVKLSGTDYKVLFKYLEFAEYGERISLHVSQADVADALGMERRNVTRSVSHLVDAGIFFREKRSLYVDPNLITKGSMWRIKPHAEE